MRFQKLLTIKSRTSSITNSFVQAILPSYPPAPHEMREALRVLQMNERQLECVYCGIPATDTDHLFPLVRDRKPTGYLHEIRNLVPSCGPCNQSKGGQDWKAWMLGKAKGSPTTRKVADITQKIERLERYVAWGRLKPVSLENLAGTERWDEYWQHLRVIEKAMEVAQEKALQVQAAIRQALDRGRRLRD
jgi:hypothetical protein